MGILQSLTNEQLTKCVNDIYVDKAFEDYVMIPPYNNFWEIHHLNENVTQNTNVILRSKEVIIGKERSGCEYPSAVVGLDSEEIKWEFKSFGGDINVCEDDLRCYVHNAPAYKKGELANLKDPIAQFEGVLANIKPFGFDITTYNPAASALLFEIAKGIQESQLRSFYVNKLDSPMQGHNPTISLATDYMVETADYLKGNNGYFQQLLLKHPTAGSGNNFIFKKDNPDSWFFSEKDVTDKVVTKLFQEIYDLATSDFNQNMSDFSFRVSPPVMEQYKKEQQILLTDYRAVDAIVKGFGSTTFHGYPIYEMRGVSQLLKKFFGQAGAIKNFVLFGSKMDFQVAYPEYKGDVKGSNYIIAQNTNIPSIQERIGNVIKSGTPGTLGINIKTSYTQDNKVGHNVLFSFQRQVTSPPANTKKGILVDNL